MATMSGARSRSVLTQAEKHTENGRDLLPHVPGSCRPLLAEFFNPPGCITAITVIIDSTKDRRKRGKTIRV